MVVASSYSFKSWIKRVLPRMEAITCVGLWWIWSHRCNFIFNLKDSWTNFRVAIQAKNMAKYFILFVYSVISYTPVDRRFHWSPPQINFIRGLVLAWDCGIKSLISETNCLDVFSLFQDLNGSSKYVDRDLFTKIHELLLRDWNVILDWVPREANRDVDRLAKYGAKNSSHVIWTHPANELQSIIFSDVFVVS
ncbi:hypothetical protein PIB30_006409 [Stylosanthes scabra]|uniref:RNase H type-1 domain-containing protein n=1 Tax=Stylosanthes scabra TaxID=79078 RepID=A0ABU6T450_9FABA|nr:hypothetical protein [Stylosanthes scabra]